jgi:hypothetical protein
MKGSIPILPLAIGSKIKITGLGLEEKTSCFSAKNFQRRKEDFDCENCGYLQQGTGYTNHCEQCLWSKHVDVNPGDRAAECGGLMAPVSADMKKTNYRIFQRCVVCDHERWNKAQPDDNFEMILEVISKDQDQNTRASEPGRFGGGNGRTRGGGKGKHKGNKTKGKGSERHSKTRY